jgi:RecA/RadA recombinase
MASLMERMEKLGSVSGASIMSESGFFNVKDVIPTRLPILNIAFSGSVDGGLVPGLTILAGASKSFKSALSLYCMKAYLDKYPDAVALFYDTEAGISLDFMKNFGIDPSRVLHIPVEHVEQLKFDMVKKLEDIKKGEKVFILVDSIGQISSKKEVEDAIDEKSVADMTRAKAIRSLLRLVTIQLTKKDIPCIMVNHVYDSIGGMFPTKVIPGGTAVMYSANQIFIISKSQEKNGMETVGFNYTIAIEKSRFVKEKTRLPFKVMYNGGIQKYSGMLDLAIEAGHVDNSSKGWYQMVDVDTGEILGGKTRKVDAEKKDFLGVILQKDSFKKFVEEKYRLSSMDIDRTEDSTDAEAEEYEANLDGDD